MSFVDVHVKLFARDLMAARPESGLFMFGQPTMLFRRCRVLGVVVDASADTMTIDDSTQCISVFIPLMMRHVKDMPRVGELVDVLGELQHDSSTGRHIACTAYAVFRFPNNSIEFASMICFLFSFEVKADARHECHRMLDILNLYMTVYFPPDPSTYNLGSFFRPPVPKPIKSSVEASKSILSIPTPTKSTAAPALQMPFFSGNAPASATSIATPSNSKFVSQRTPSPSPFVSANRPSVSNTPTAPTTLRAPSPPVGSKRSFVATASAGSGIFASKAPSQSPVPSLPSQSELNVDSVLRVLSGSSCSLVDLTAKLNATSAADAHKVAEIIQLLVDDGAVYVDGGRYCVL
jgi:hypothetical protein